MRYIGIVLCGMIIVVVPLLFRFLLKKSESKKQLDNQSIIIRQPKFYLYVGICGVVFADIIIPILCFLELDPSMNWLESLLFSLIAIIPLNILYIYISLLYLNWKVTVYDDGVLYQNIFRKKHMYKFSEYQVKTFNSSYRLLKKEVGKKHKSKVYINISMFCPFSDSIKKAYDSYKKTT